MPSIEDTATFHVSLAARVRQIPEAVLSAGPTWNDEFDLDLYHRSALWPIDND